MSLYRPCSWAKEEGVHCCPSVSPSCRRVPSKQPASRWPRVRRNRLLVVHVLFLLCIPCAFMSHSNGRSPDNAAPAYHIHPHHVLIRYDVQMALCWRLHVSKKCCQLALDMALSINNPQRIPEQAWWHIPCMLQNNTHGSLVISWICSTKRVYVLEIPSSLSTNGATIPSYLLYIAHTRIWC